MATYCSSSLRFSSYVANNQAGKSILKTDYKSTSSIDTEMKTDDNDDEGSISNFQGAVKLAVKVLNKTMDGTGAGAEKMEIFRPGQSTTAKSACTTFPPRRKRIDAVEAEAAAAAAGDS